MNKVCIIGSGNVATHLCIALAGKVDELINVSSRELEDLPMDSDIYLIAVSDSAIGKVADAMPRVDGIVAHTAGSVGIDVLKPYFKRVGVFYPLQTFTKGAYLDYSVIPVFVEASDKGSEGQLLGLASLFTTHLHKADSARRETLHLASVFACNFTNYLWTAADEILQREGLNLDVLMPLIDATVSKLKYMDPSEAQTGPASRGDTEVISRHEKALEGTKLHDIYHILSEAILSSKTTPKQ
ncbi:MAG: DUF2520 domain-containing protein [Muribaculaceae bacterium]|nr:DUF2520 domain-containing protein [Muribaculaceae bacterium]